MNTPQNKQKTAIILINLGTPDQANEQAIKRYLRQFLSDTRVIEIPMFLWKIILNLFVLPIRAKKVAHAYQLIWQEDSPIRQILNQQVEALNGRFENRFDNCDVHVYSAMTYGNPSIPKVFDKLQEDGIDNFVILPTYPQYSSTTTGAVYDAISKWSMSKRELPNISIIKDYYQNPLYIKVLADSVRNFQQEHGKAEKLLMSFHGIPQPYADKGDYYPQRCLETAQKLADELGLNEDEWLCSFQSRFGLQEWVKPYTDETLIKWGETGIKSVQVISPAFSADCLETLEELTIQNRDVFLQAGGKEYAYIPALNANKGHIDLFENVLLDYLPKR